MSTRNANLDSLRVVMLILGVPFHGALPFLPGGGWLIEADQTSAVLKAIADTIHVFRMPVFFLLSGLLAAGSLAKTGHLAWLRRRCLFLLPPVIIGFVLINTVQMLIIYEYGLLYGADSIRYSTTYHMWFLVVLLVFSAVIAVLPLANRLYGLAAETIWLAVARRAAPAAMPALLMANALLAIAAFAAADEFCRLALGRPIPAELTVFAHYLPPFLFGLFLASNPQARADYLAAGAGAWLLALGTIALHVALASRPETASTAAATWSWVVAGWFATRAIVAAFASARRPILAWMPFRPELGLPFYLLHHPFVLVFGLVLAATPMPVWQAYGALVFLTFLATTVSVRLITASPLALRAFGVPSRPNARPATLPADPAQPGIVPLQR